MAGLKSTTYTMAESTDVTGAKFQDRGYIVMAMDNGDKVYVRFQGTGSITKEGALNGEGTWSYTRGTGKFKGVHGKGTWKSTEVPGQSQVEGEYSLAESKPTSKKN